jgi:RNA polymerase sigma-70 factor (ECF subfamily)
MTAFAFPNLEGGSVVGHGDFPGRKIVQRISPPAVSHIAKPILMADADAELVCQSQSGDPSAFEELVRRHQKMIHALTFRMTGSPADAEDLAQEAFLRAWEQIAGFHGGAKFSTWLCSIAVHGCLNWRRDEARRHHAHANCAEEMRAEDGVEICAGESETAFHAQAALLKLPAKQRAAVVLTIYEGLNHAEAAKILRCSETTVSWRVFAAKRKLKSLLSKTEARHE